jgi:hypothetical protein
MSHAGEQAVRLLSDFIVKSCCVYVAIGLARSGKHDIWLALVVGSFLARWPPGQRANA